MKLEDLYKSELSNLHVEPPKGGYDRVKTALVRRIVKHTFIFSMSFVLFFIGLGELADYKKSQANKEFHFPSKFFKKNSSKVENPAAQSPTLVYHNESFGLKKRPKKNTLTNSHQDSFERTEEKNTSSSNYVLLNNFLFQMISNSPKKSFENYVETPKEAYGTLHISKQLGLEEKKSNQLFSALNEKGAENEIAKKEELKQVSLEQNPEIGMTHETEEANFSTKKGRKLKLSLAALYSYNNNLLPNAYEAHPSFAFHAGFVLPLANGKVAIRSGINYSYVDQTLNKDSKWDIFAPELQIKYYNIEIPFSVECPMHLNDKTTLSLGTGARYIAAVSTSEHSKFVDGTEGDNTGLSDKFKKNYMTFFGYAVLSRNFSRVNANVFMYYHPSFARVKSLSNYESVFDNYGVSSLQVGVGLDF